MTHIMLDLETMGTKPGCAIVSVGACKFSLAGIHSEFYMAIDPRWVPRGASTELGTAVWWTRQSEMARAVFNGPVQHYNHVLYHFDKWCRESLQQPDEPIFLWGHGAAFDAPILQAYFELAEQDMGIPFWNWRDTRTVYAMTGIKPTHDPAEHHNALADAKAQALAVIEAYKKLGVELA